MDLSPGKRFKRRVAGLRNVREINIGERKRKQARLYRRVWENRDMVETCGRMRRTVTPSLVLGMFGNGRSSQCSVRSSLWEEKSARRKGDLQQPLAVHSRQDVQTVLNAEMRKWEAGGGGEEVGSEKRNNDTSKNMTSQSKETTKSTRLASVIPLSGSKLKPQHVFSCSSLSSSTWLPASYHPPFSFSSYIHSLTSPCSPQRLLTFHPKFSVQTIFSPSLSS